MSNLAQNSSVKIELLWRGNKSRNRARGFPASPPILYFGNPPGFAFTNSHNTLYFTNFEYLLRLRLGASPNKPLSVVHQWRDENDTAQYLALTNDSKQLYTCAHYNHNDYLQVLSLFGSELKRVPIQRKTGLPNRLFGKLITEDGPYHPFRCTLTPRTTLLVWEPYQWEQLCEYDLEGRLVHEWTGVKGVVVDEEGTLWVHGSPQPSRGVRVHRPPSALDPVRLTLLGRDRHGRWYWRRSAPRTFDHIAYYTSRIACESAEGRLLWQIELDGPQGVLAKEDPYWHASGSTGGWIEVEPEGTLLVFCVSRSRKMEGGVGLYRVEVILE